MTLEYEEVVVQINNSLSPENKRLADRLRDSFAQVPLLAWLCGVLGAVLLERFFGDPLTEILGLPKIPALFGAGIVLKKPQLIPGTVAFLFLI